MSSKTEPSRRGRRRSRTGPSSVVSLRIDADIRRLLEGRARSSRQTLSALLREALELWAAQADRLVPPTTAPAVGTDRAKAGRIPPDSLLRPR